MPEPPIALPSGIIVWRGQAYLIVKIGDHDVIGSPADLVVSDKAVIVANGLVEIRRIIGFTPPGPL